MWYKHMQTAISINSCYRRAVQHRARWIYCTRGVRGGHQNQGEMGQQIHWQLWSQIARTRANATRLLFSADVVSRVTVYHTTDKSLGCCFLWVWARRRQSLECTWGPLLCILTVWWGAALTDQFLLPGFVMDIPTNSAKAKSLMLLTKNKNFRSLLIFVPFTWFQDP